MRTHSIFICALAVAILAGHFPVASAQTYFRILDPLPPHDSAAGASSTQPSSVEQHPPSSRIARAPVVAGPAPAGAAIPIGRAPSELRIVTPTTSIAPRTTQLVVRTVDDPAVSLRARSIDRAAPLTVPPMPEINPPYAQRHSAEQPIDLSSATNGEQGTRSVWISAPPRSPIFATTDPFARQASTLQSQVEGDEGSAVQLPAPPRGVVVEPLEGQAILAESAPVDYGLPISHLGCPYLPGQSGTPFICGVACGRAGAPCNAKWSDSQCIPWSLFGPGEYVGPARSEHVSPYYLRVNDLITVTFIESRQKSAQHYRIGVGDHLLVEWLQSGPNTPEASLNRQVLVQPDGTVTLPILGDVAAAGKTLGEFRDEVVKLYSKYQREPQITISPVTVNVAIRDVLTAVTSKSSASGQTQDLKITPEGTIQAAGIGSVYVQGLTLDELRSELEARYAAIYGPGLTISPALTQRATSYVFLGGEVRNPGRYTLEGPTTVMQAISLAGGWNNGGNMRQVVIFRRDDNWCLSATKVDIRAPFYGKDPCPTNDVWLRDNDLVIVPKSTILCATDVIQLYFTRGVYAVFPMNYVYDFSKNSGIAIVP